MEELAGGSWPAAPAWQDHGQGAGAAADRIGVDCDEGVEAGSERAEADEATGAQLGAAEEERGRAGRLECLAGGDERGAEAAACGVQDPGQMAPPGCLGCARDVEGACGGAAAPAGLLPEDRPAHAACGRLPGIEQVAGGGG